MPHVVVDHSGNLTGQIDMTALCLRLRDEMLASGLFELGAVRIRAVAAETWCIADCHPENSYADVRVRIGSGRSLDDRRALGERMITALQEQFATLLNRPLCIIGRVSNPPPCRGSRKTLGCKALARRGDVPHVRAFGAFKGPSECAPLPGPMAAVQPP